MKNLFFGLATFGLLAFAGCDTGKPGGPGATVNDNSNRVVGNSENTFTLDTPVMATAIHQGEAKEVKISISRGKNFDQDVMIKFANVPAGVTITPTSPTLVKSDKEVNVTVTAADDAAVNTFSVDVFGHPASGPDSKNELKLKIEKK